ncbi:MAG: glutamate racemase [Bacteroidetes bacterium]|nr:glutamate racemase [Bacteroidota bacterium]
MDNARPIGVFDSGIGGMTVVRAIMQHLPHENIVYFGDTARVPYGPKSPQVVREYALQDTDVLLKHDVKLIVIACNTVSAVALDVVQKRAKVPVVGVIIPGAEAAVKASAKKRIGIIGTLGTIFSNAYTNAIRQIDPAVKVTGQPCPLFVPLAEEGWIDHKATELIAKEYLFPLTLEKVDTVVLGCTHYPILRKIIQKVLHSDVTLIDSGEATTVAVKKMLKDMHLENTSTQKPNLKFFVSDVPHKFMEIGEQFLGTKLGKVHRVEGFLT